MAETDLSVTDQPDSTAATVAALDALCAFLDGATLGAWPARGADLERLGVARGRLLRRFTLAVVGEFSSGKSYLRFWDSPGWIRVGALPGCWLWISILLRLP